MPKNFMDLTDRVVAVIGGTSGLGRVIALGLAEAGAHVVATGRRQQNVDEVCDAVRGIGRETLSHTVDVGQRASIDTFRDAVVARFGRVDVLVNAAGRIKRIPTMELPEEEWQSTIDTNLTGMLRCCQSFHDALAASKRGRIINIASLTTFVGFFEVTAYSASKGGVQALTHSLAIEWARHGINVNSIAPGVFRTDLNAALLDGTERGRELLMRTPLGRFGKLDEVIGAAVLLASDAASFITGQCIVVDGGFMASGVNT